MSYIKFILSLFLGFIPILILIRDWKFNDKRTKKHHQITRIIIVCWTILSFISCLFIWIEPNLEKNRLEKYISNSQPQIELEIIESIGHLFLTINSAKEISEPVEELFFKFDIPGRFIKSQIIYKDKIDEISIFPRWSCVLDENDTISCTLHLHTKTILPLGFTRIKIDYEPTVKRKIPGSENINGDHYYMPLMDLHDFSKLLYTWKYLSKLHTVTKFIDLRYLKYIQDDNEVFKATRINENFWRKTNEPNIDKAIDSLKNKYSNEWVKDWEWKRWNW